MGAPRTGLLTAARAAWDQKDSLTYANFYVVDIGIAEIWKSYGEQLELASGTGPEFGLKWFFNMRPEEDPGYEDEDGDDEAE
jgi:hypothetical protein